MSAGSELVNDRGYESLARTWIAPTAPCEQYSLRDRICFRLCGDLGAYVSLR
jgi:hypothetical protein